LQKEFSLTILQAFARQGAHRPRQMTLNNQG
jgi:hypothetical protein